MAKKYLNVSYEDRELAKRLGARWDPSVKKWYCPQGAPLAKIFTWRSQQILNSPSNTLTRKTKLPKVINLELPLTG